MKKNISINLQGLIFHIEEDGYDVLSRYLAEVKAHFSGYRGHEEIVADIEGRIAELFAARTSATKQIITLTDVQEMVAKMGRVSDFQSADEAEDEEEALAGGPAAYTSYADGASAAAAAGTPTGSTATAEEPRRLYRDMANRKIAGVAAGIARYFAVNPLWIRLVFLMALFIRPLLGNIFHYDGHAFRFEGFDLGGIAFLAYIIFWIALPKRYDATPANEDPTFRKLYRDTDTGKVGGVSAGLAAYFKLDVVVVRLLFVVFIFAGGFAIPLYIILWILLPEAKTVSDKMRMRGDAVTLSGIDNTLRSNAFTDEPGAVAGNGNRPLGMFLEDLFRNLRPLLNFIGSAIRIFAGVMLVIIGFSLVVGITIALVAGLGWIPESQNIVLGDVPAYILLRGFSFWSLFAFYGMAVIPALATLLSGIGLLLRRTVLTRTVGLSLLGLWLLSVVGSSMAFAALSHNFQNQGEQTQVQRFPALAAPTLFLDTRSMDRSSGQNVDVEFVAADSAQVVSVDKIFSSKGATEAEATRTAATSIGYTVRQTNDSTLVFDDHFSFLPDASYRDQELRLTVHLPRNKYFRISEDFSYWISSENFVNDQRPENPEKHLFRLRNNRLECVDCTEQELRGDDFGSDFDGDDEEADSTDAVVNINTGEGNMRVRVNTDDDEDGNVGVRIDVDEASFSASPADYGPERRNFNLSGFRQIEASGAYRVYVRQGPEFKAEAAGNDRELRNLRVDTDGDQLVISSRRESFFSGFASNRKPVLIRVQLPELRGLELSGACQANVAGFSGPSLRVDQSGASNAMLNVKVTRLVLDLNGACRTDLRGTATELAVDGSGACQVNALGMPVQRAEFDLSGISKAKVRVSDRLRAELSGASRLQYAGQPTSIQKDLSGSSRVTPIAD
ncbi:phage shock protein C (PspC) family protein [Hymenobacter daecheongensis DSM 21074]|uniref:Phage shock protein C (PspC) family protein n=1 Tax=Hymenobacter daecheongensis DSM 21074 TaxID=1121955 RepID=A0A1M6F0J2_9BACT|nr:PspC domain-containing protein [Hymenobacter daecheongensis]SHI91203.1 phage shock protein C (PspC) family protein [Hymenobacter daecheongensis DSM 21074]